MSNQVVVTTYEEACREVERWGILPLSNCIPEHPSLEGLTLHRAWHTGLENDPWLWRDRFADEGVAAYGRFLLGKPLLVSREVFPLLRGVLNPAETIDERYRDGVLARLSLQIYELIEENEGVDVKALRKLAGMQERSAKLEFEHALGDLQATADIVISGIASGRLNEYGNKSGWSSTCYMLAQHWMDLHQFEDLSPDPGEAQTSFFGWLASHWEAGALAYIQKKIGQKKIIRSGDIW